jgi:hypothetical protein
MFDNLPSSIGFKGRQAAPLAVSADACRPRSRHYATSFRILRRAHGPASASPSTPAEIIYQLNREINAASPTQRSRHGLPTLEEGSSFHPQYARGHRGETDKWAKVTKFFGATANGYESRSDIPASTPLLRLTCAIGCAIISLATPQNVAR